MDVGCLIETKKGQRERRERRLERATHPWRRCVHFEAQRQLHAERDVPLVECDVVIVHGISDGLPQALAAAREQFVVCAGWPASQQRERHEGGGCAGASRR
eukprot:7386719-Prymnesium_polylepis.1